MKNRTWIKTPESETLSSFGKDVSIRCISIKETGAYVLINRESMFIYEDTDYDKVYKQIELYK